MEMGLEVLTVGGDDSSEKAGVTDTQDRNSQAVGGADLGLGLGLLDGFLRCTLALGRESGRCLSRSVWAISDQFITCASPRRRTMFTWCSKLVLGFLAGNDSSEHA